MFSVMLSSKFTWFSFRNLDEEAEGENLRQAEMAMGRLLKEQSHGRRLPGGDL